VGNGRPVWRVSVGMLSGGGADGNLVAVVPTRRGDLLDAKSGATRWRARAPAKCWPHRRPARPAFVRSADSRVFASTTQRRWCTSCRRALIVRSRPA
jgi:hypothetical protein